MTSRGNLSENHLAFAVSHTLWMRLCEKLHESGVFGESTDGILDERNVFSVDSGLSRKLITEVEIDPKMKMVRNIVAFQHASMPLNERFRFWTPFRKLYSPLNELNLPISSMLGCCEVNTEGSVKYSGMHSSGVHSNIRSMLHINPGCESHFPGYSLLWKLLRTTTRSSEIGIQRAI